MLAAVAVAIALVVVEPTFDSAAVADNHPGTVAAVELAGNHLGIVAVADVEDTGSCWIPYVLRIPIFSFAKHPV